MDVDSSVRRSEKWRVSLLQWSHVLMDVDRGGGIAGGIGGAITLQWSHVLMDVDSQGASSR